MKTLFCIIAAMFEYLETIDLFGHSLILKLTRLLLIYVYLDPTFILNIFLVLIKKQPIYLYTNLIGRRCINEIRT